MTVQSTELQGYLKDSAAHDPSDRFMQNASMKSLRSEGFHSMFFLLPTLFQCFVVSGRIDATLGNLQYLDTGLNVLQ